MKWILNILIVLVLTACSSNQQVVKKGDRVFVTYRISTKEGWRLDESSPSINLNKAPKNDELFSFVVGQNEVISGWDSIIVGCKTNTLYTFELEAVQAYGSEKIYHELPPNSPLQIQFKVIDIE